MITQDIIDYYANLLIMQYAGKPKAYATIQLLASMVVMDQLPTEVENAFNLTGDDTAVGVQLDVLGKYAGVVRDGLGIYGPISLSDADFLTLIRLAISRNSAGSSLYDIQILLATYFLNQIYVFDYANMHMSYLIDSDVGSFDLVQMFISQGLLPRPMGVQLSVVYATDIANFFGMRSYQTASELNTPLNDYADYNTSWQWLRYENAVVI